MEPYSNHLNTVSLLAQFMFWLCTFAAFLFDVHNVNAKWVTTSILGGAGSQSPGNTTFIPCISIRFVPEIFLGGLKLKHFFSLVTYYNFFVMWIIGMTELIWVWKYEGKGLLHFTKINCQFYESRWKEKAKFHNVKSKLIS